MSSAQIRIGERPVGPGAPLYFIAEAGSNHDGNLQQAFRLIDVAAEAGADAVKFQAFRADNLYPRGAGLSGYLKSERSIYDIIRDLEMPLEWIPELASHCRKRGLAFLCTPFDETSADAIAPYVPAFKIASYEMTHYALIQHVARRGKPLIVSTGTSTLDEVREMVRAVRAVSDAGLVVLQCTAKYPAPLAAINVRALAELATLGVLTGLSDHSREPLAAPLAAVALGASVIEKHFTLSNTLPGPDHAYALEPDELKQVVSRIREVEQCLGTGEKVVQPEERELRAFARRTIFSIRSLSAGSLVARRDVAVLRSGKLPYGLHPKEYLRLLGRRVLRPVPAEASITLDDVGPLRLEMEGMALRPLEAQDTAHIVAWRGRADVARQLFSDRPPSAAEHDRWFESAILRSDRIDFVIVDRELGPVGTVSLSEIDFAARGAEYGIMLGEPAARGRGLARRASVIILDYAFDILDLEEVRLKLFADNEPGRRLYDRLGFVASRDQPDPRLKDGVERQVVAMALGRESWRAKRNDVLRG